MELTSKDYTIEKFAKENAQLKVQVAELEFAVITAKQEIERLNEEINKMQPDYTEEESEVDKCE